MRVYCSYVKIKSPLFDLSKMVQFYAYVGNSVNVLDETAW